MQPASHMYMLRRPGVVCVQRMSIAEMQHLELLPSFVSALASQPSTCCEVVQTQHEVCHGHCLEQHAISPTLLADLTFKHRARRDAI